MSIHNTNPTPPDGGFLFDFPGGDRLEFHRFGLALAPELDDKNPGVAVLVFDESGNVGLRTCSCDRNKSQTCDHILQLSGICRILLKNTGGNPPYHHFKSGVLHTMAEVLGDKGADPAENILYKDAGQDGGSRVIIRSSDGRELARYYSDSPDKDRLLQRLGDAPGLASETGRREILHKLYLMSLTKQERMLLDKGHKSFRLLLEESFWYRFMYHLFREFGDSGFQLEPAVEERTGEFTISGIDKSRGRIFRLNVPRNRVKAMITALKEKLPNQQGLGIHPIPLQSIYKVGPFTELDLEIRPQIVLRQANGAKKYLESEDFKKYRYGDLVYLKDLGLMAELEKQGGKIRRFNSPERMILKKSQVPAFIEEYQEDIRSGRIVAETENTGLTILKSFDRMEINPDAMDRDWLWLDVRYGFGDTEVSLAQLLQARQDGQRYVKTTAGWVDTEAPAFDVFDVITRYRTGERGRVGLTPMDLLRLSSYSNGELKLSGRLDRVALLKKLLDLRPMEDAPPPEGLKSDLRPYQKTGYQWLRFLHENSLGGLLCDDMGLGKTHQAMAILVHLAESGEKAPMLVVCPTTVMSHWKRNVKKFAPGLKASIFHGPGRRLSRATSKDRLVITSFGVLRQNSKKLGKINWKAVVFDEIQNLKNPQTQSYDAAGDISAGFRLGLTGTPVENSIEELKALFDLVLPGYFGSDHHFRKRYVKEVRANPESGKADELRRLISPFVLRRTKETVLDELPPKITDLRFCELSDEQIKLYREAVESRGAELVNKLKQPGERIPYIHIFSVLGKLKQICNHPAQLDESWENYEEHESGKWELFKEILAESLAGRQKVVVYSQYLNMIGIIEHHLNSLGVGYAVLTGQSRKRGEIIDRFAEDPNCRVFVSSLMAGGVGIDLIAASVVIHYDRWWNAAREDQATDRVHRIGQRRGVQVFKLVTLGTLEEKISAIIDKKRALMESIVREDDENAVKACTKQELIDLLTFAG